MNYLNLFLTVSLLWGLVRPSTYSVHREYHPSPNQISDPDIPESFDARDKWPACESLGKIRDQQNCNAAWAFAAAEIMTDRLCIATNASVKMDFSPEDLLSCCDNCGDCDDGDSGKVWAHLMNNGVVSGGDNDRFHQGCVPYTESTGLHNRIPSCVKRCQIGYPFSYEEDRYFADIYYYFYNERNMQMSIMADGPVESRFKISEDFLTYENGVYEPKPDAGLLGYTYMKVFGWGVEDGTPYWLAAASRGADWGLNGFCKILRGTTATRLEILAVSGDVKIDGPSTTTDTPPTTHSATPFTSTPTTTTPSSSVKRTISWPIVCVPFWLLFFYLPYVQDMEFSSKQI